MGPLQQLGVSSMAYNRQPNYEPMALKRPSQFCQLENSGYIDSGPISASAHRTEASSYLRENLATFIERDSDSREQLGKTSQDLLANMLANRQLTERIDPVKSLPTSQNSSPRPYSSQGQQRQVDEHGPATTSYYRPHPQPATKSALSLGNLSQASQFQQGGGEHLQHYQQQASPQILVNDQPVMCRYPTSTVHKSMLNSRARQLQSNCCNAPDQHHQHHVAYSRLISPAVHSESLSPGSDFASAEARSASVSEHQQQHQQRQKVEKPIPDFPSAQQAGSIEAQPPANLSRLSQDVAGQTRGAAKRDQRQQTAVSSSSSPSAATSLLLPTSLKPKQSIGLGLGGGGGSSVVCPDTKRDEYMWNRQLERVSIAHQTYRTLPIVSPKPKARHDLVTGCTYMNYGQDLSYELALQSRPSSSSSREHERKIQQAIDEASERPPRAQQTGAAVSMAINFGRRLGLLSFI